MFNINMESNKMVDVAQMIDGVAGAIKTDVHINEVLKNANVILTGEFVLHMSREAISNVQELGHMFEWNRVGDPSARLWKHILRGQGRNRQLTFTFKASKSTVPVTDVLRAVGVQQRHIFVWKAPVIEFGLPVRISPVIAKALVFEAKGRTGSGKSGGDAYVRNGIVFHKGTVSIPRAGSTRAWGAFSKAFNEWFTGTQPTELLRREIDPATKSAVNKAVKEKLAKIRSSATKKKTFSITVGGVDSSFEKKLVQSLTRNYAQAAANRRVLTTDDEV